MFSAVEWAYSPPPIELSPEQAIPERKSQYIINTVSSNGEYPIRGQDSGNPLSYTKEVKTSGSKDEEAPKKSRGKNESHNRPDNGLDCSLGSIYWDKEAGVVENAGTHEDRSFLDNDFFQRQIMRISFIPEFPQSHSTKNKKTTLKPELTLEGVIHEFFRTDNPTEFLTLHELKPEAFEFLCQDLNQVKMKFLKDGKQTHNQNSMLRETWQPSLALRLWEKKISYSLTKGASHVEDLEFSRRVMAFQFQFYSKYDYKMWEEGKSSKSASSNVFVSKFYLDKPWDIVSDASEEDFNELKTAYEENNGNISDELKRSLYPANVKMLKTMWQIKERQLRDPAFRPFFGKKLLHHMFMQGVDPTNLIKLDMVLRFSSPEVSWENLDSTQLISKYEDMVSAISAINPAEVKGVSNSEKYEKAQEYFSATLVKAIIKRNPPLYILFKARTKMLLHQLAKIIPHDNVGNLFPSYKTTVIREHLFPYDQALAAHISGVEPELLMYVKLFTYQHQKFIQRTRQNQQDEQLTQVIFSPADVDDKSYMKLKEYSALLGIDIRDDNGYRAIRSQSSKRSGISKFKAKRRSS